MKHLRHLALSVLLVLSLTATALAAEVPVSLVVENLNGQQRIVKTYELPPGTDPETLKEPSFTYDGFTYTWAYTTKDEHIIPVQRPNGLGGGHSPALGSVARRLRGNGGVIQGQLTGKFPVIVGDAGGQLLQDGIEVLFPGFHRHRLGHSLGFQGLRFQERESDHHQDHWAAGPE